MSLMKSFGLATLTLFIALALNVDSALADPKHKGDKHEREMIKMEEEHAGEMPKDKKVRFRQNRKNERARAREIMRENEKEHDKEMGKNERRKEQRKKHNK
jgi:hypothetical protein